MPTPSPAYIYPTVIFLWIVSPCSIGFSSWQFQSCKEKFPYSYDYATDSLQYKEFKELYCDGYFEYIGPFASNEFDGSYVYCGYGKVNTGFRICLGCINLIFSSFMIYRKCSGDSLLSLHNLSFGKMALKAFYIVLGLLWYCALCIDSMAMGMMNDSQVSPIIN